MSDRHRIRQIYEILSEHPRLGHNDLRNKVCTQQKLMAWETFEDNLKTGVDKGIFSKTSDLVGNVKRVWYSVWIDFDKKEPQMVAVIESKLVEFDRLFERFVSTLDSRSVYERGTIVFLFQKLLRNIREVATFYQDVYYGQSSTFRTIHNSVDKREKAVYNIVRKDALRIRKQVLGIVSFHAVSDHNQTLAELHEIIGN